jgi:phosphatidylserine/phosphatidylglycerophosphate/cardiolipin synthase-like enzyme
MNQQTKNATITCYYLLILLFASIYPSILLAQEDLGSAEAKYVHSMGLSSKTHLYWGPMFVMDDLKTGSNLGGQLYAGLIRDIFSPIFGVGIGAEAYAESVQERDFDGGARLFLSFKPFFFQYGVDYAIDRNSLNSIWSFIFPVRRGGLFGSGSELRIDWLPSRGHTVDIGFRFYFGPRSRGIARPKHDQFHLPRDSAKNKPAGIESPSNELQQTLEYLAHAAKWMNLYTTPFFDQKDISDEDKSRGFLQHIEAIKGHMNMVDSLYPEGHDVQAEINMYHRMLERAFVLALEGEHSPGRQHGNGRIIADKAREIMFRDVIIPYNRLLGLGKKNDSLLGYGQDARTDFANWFNSSNFSPETQQTANYVFDMWLEILEKIRSEARSGWKDSELVWLPLQYGLRPEQYATRDSLKHVLELVLEKPFVDCNEVYYVIDERFQPEVARTILQAQDYHVLWIHDYRGKNAVGDPDRVSFRQALNYIQALTNAVENYDVRGRMPLYIIAIDQYFYSLMKGEFWLALLQDPLEYHLKLPKEFHEWSEEIETAQNKLQAAVDASERLQAEAARYGNDWIEKTVKVHVNITNPADYAFRSRHIIGAIPFTPDEIMRDHRKIVFFDVSEDDPAKGEAIYSGVGIGEQYVGPTWDDRSILVRGPALLSLKYEFLELLRQQGFKEDEIPEPLRKKRKPADYDARVAELREKGWISPVMDVHNHTGFRQKNVNVMKATLYNLMPPGSVLLLPDGLWNAPFWGSMVAGAALRGCRVLVIGISPERSAFFLESRSQEVFARLILFQQGLNEEIESAGGLLKTGIYNRQSPLGDAVAAYDEMSAGFRANPFLKELFPFTQEAHAELEQLVEEAKTHGFTPYYYAQDAKPRKPKLHLKINFFMSDEVRLLLSQPGWETIVREYWKYHEKFVLKQDPDLKQDNYVDLKEITEEMRVSINNLLLRHWHSLSPKERDQAITFLTVGSHNHNYRSMISDGESACLVAGFGSLVALLDMFTLTGLSVWIDDLESLEPFLPEYSGFKRRFSRHIRKIM